MKARENADAKKCRREESMAIIPGNADELTMVEPHRERRERNHDRDIIGPRESRNALYGETRMRATYKKLEKQSKA